MNYLKYYDAAVTLSEFPDEIALCVNITNCPCNCENCSEPWLKKDIGTLLTFSEIDSLINNHPDITVFGILGGDSNHDAVFEIARYIHQKYPLIKVGFYSGRDYLDINLISVIDLYKIGRWINPVGSSESWFKTNNGSIQFPWSNQLYFEKIDNKLINATYKFRKEIINNPENYIIR